MCPRRYYNQPMRHLLPILLLVLLTLACSCDVIKSTQIENGVVKALAGDSRTSDFTFQVSHEGDGRVLITGEVDTAEQIEAVKEIAAAVDGVADVSVRIGITDNSSSGLMQDTVINTPYF